MGNEPTDNVYAAWRTYVVDSDGRRLTPALVGPAADFTHPDSAGSLALETLPGPAGMEIEHAPTGVRVIVPRLSALPLEDLRRLSQLPGVLRAAADLFDPPRRGPRGGSIYGGEQLRFRITEMWLRTGKPPTQEAVALDLEIDPSALSRAVRGSGYSIRGSERKGKGSGWDNQLAVAAMFLRHLQARLPALAPDESELVRREREMLNALDLTEF